MSQPEKLLRVGNGVRHKVLPVDDDRGRRNGGPDLKAKVSCGLQRVPAVIEPRALVGHVKTTLATQGVIVNCGRNVKLRSRQLQIENQIEELGRKMVAKKMRRDKVYWGYGAFLVALHWAT